LNARIVNNVEASIVSSDAGGTVAFGFDADVETILTQAAPNGSITANFTDSTYVQVIGLLPGTTATLDLVFDVSMDGVAWRTIFAPGATAYVDREWVWYDISRVAGAPFFRMRETGGGIISMREICFSTSQTELPVAIVNREIYTAMPNK